MNYFARIWGIAGAEIRSAFRLARTWLFIAVGFLISGATWLQNGMYFFYNSGLNPYVALMSNTRYTFANQFAGLLFLIFSIGIVFLAFDLRVRDRSSRIHEALESRPLDNFGFLLGRTLGITLVVSVPMILTMSLVTGVALFTQAFAPVQLESAQPHSFWYTVLVDIVPNMFFYAAFVVFLAMVLRYRLLVILSAIGMMIAQFWLVANAPIHLVEILGWVTAQNLPSDIDTFFTNAWILLERLLLFLLGFGLLFLAAMAYHRHDGPVISRRIAVGTGLLVLGVLGFGYGFVNIEEIKDQRDEWYAVHKEADERWPDTMLDLESLEGSIVIDPGKNLSIDLTLNVNVISEQGSNGLLFSLNPDLVVHELLVDGNAVQQYKFEHGLLMIEESKHYRSGSNVELEISASGIPNNQFEYFDSAIDLYSSTMFDAPMLRLLGEHSLIFDRDFVALISSGAWYPQVGPHIYRDRTSRRPIDFFTIDVEVETPENWTVAGPGKAADVVGSSNRIRLNPTVPLSSLNLLADEFHRVSTEVRGTEFELLLHPKHTKNLPLFGDIVPEIEEEIENILKVADSFGLQYPLASLSIVEVPTTMRIFGGGWRMDSVQSLPGVLLLKELSFPTVNFNSLTGADHRAEWDEERLDAFKLSLLRTFVKNDMHGGNVFLGFARNLFSNQTGATGECAEALNFLLEKIVSQLVVKDTGFFSAYFVASTGDSNFAFNTSSFSRDRDEPRIVSNRMRSYVFSRPEVWEAAVETPLSQLPLESDPKKAYNVLELKVTKLASVFADEFGHEEMGEILSEVLDQYRGRSFTYDDFLAVAEGRGIDVEERVGDWLDSAALPGFIVSEVEIVRVNDDENDFPRYQTSFHVRNGEPVPGLLLVEYEVNDVDLESEAIRIGGNSAVEINLVTSDPPEDVELEPYLSLNRNDIEVFLPRRGDGQRIERIDAEPKNLVEPSEWRLETTDSIVVDDLDAGFSTDYAEPISGIPRVVFWLSGVMPEQRFDAGLPMETTPLPGVWTRRTTWGSYGAYRKTTARSRPAPESEPVNAYFTTDIPTSGRWQLEYHLPLGTRRNSERRGFSIRMPGINMGRNFTSEQGVYDVSVQFDDEELPIEFDAADANDGWVLLGEFEIPATTVKVRVSNVTTGGLVIADAIRWTPATSS